MGAAKRTIRFPNRAKGNPGVCLQLTDADRWNGIVVEIELDGALRRLEYESRHMTWITLTTVHHRDAEKRGVLRFKPPTWASFKDFLKDASRDRKSPGLYFKPPTRHHEQALAYVCYAAIPIWAKSEAAYIERWGCTGRWGFHGRVAWDPDRRRAA